MKSLLKYKAFFPKSFILLFFASLFTACDEQVVYHSFQALSNEGWQRKDTLFFPLSVKDSATYYQVSIHVRNRSNYPYENLPLLICYDNPENKNVQLDTLRLTLSDKEGNWKGKGWGELYLSTFPAGTVHITRPGEYRIKVTYLLPDPVLQGINDLGIKLKR